MSYLRTLDWDQLTSSIERFSQSEITKSAIAQIVPCASADVAEEQMKHTFDAIPYVSPNRPLIQSLDSIPLWLPRLKKGAILSGHDLKDAKLFFYEAEGLINILSSTTTDWGNSLLSVVESFGDEIVIIERIIDSEGNILPTASPTLESLNLEKTQLSKNIHDRLRQILHDHQIENMLQDKFVTTRDGRWVVPVKYGMQGKFPGIIHDVSNTGQSLFIEPQEVVNTNNKLREIELAIDAEIERILKHTSGLLSKRVSALEENFKSLKDADLRFAFATYAQKTEANAIRFSETALNLVQLRNPILVLEKKNVVSNTIELDKNKTVLLVSGPNAGGKTILLKSVGLTAQLARCGIPVCCEASSSIPFFKHIFTSVGDSQNIKEGLSTFAAHMLELNESLKSKPFEDLILIDEICGSTDPEEGSALARAFIEYYGKNHIFSLTTSHLSPLKIGWEDNSGVLTASMNYDESIGAPTYRLISGVSGSSFAWKTAQKIGVADVILSRAKEFMSEIWKKRNEKMEDLESIKQDLITEKQKNAIQAEDIIRQKSKYEALLSNFEKEKLAKIEELTRDAQKRLEQVFDDIKQGNKKSPLEWKVDLPQIIKGKVEKELTAEEFARSYPSGSDVFIQTIGRPGVVQSSPNAKGEVSVLSNSMRLQIHYKYLVPQQAHKPKAEVPSVGSKYAVDDCSLDLRGLSLEEAMDKLESQIDTALKDQIDRIKVIHGHGTNTLKKAIRAYCARSEHIKKWQAGNPDQGGDGITWIEI
ncbi:MAG: Smr/MutS family protein [Bdellovibrionales bacterium]|nr:Smr/MutS family protein [Bdellovibrionales bacterium]